MVGEFFLLMLAGGALATAGFSAVTDFPVWVDGVFFAITSFILVLLVRPALKKRFSVPELRPSGIDALPGKSALVLEDIDLHAGAIRLEGEVWTARPFDGTQTYAAGETVTVMEIDGATAVVWRGP
ncbi:MAG: NfeD family protein [Rhodococcus sp.]|nr:NfeD family protein [Rhodococcus sp. (in: high G+C Gram-positive bacteria)]